MIMKTKDEMITDVAGLMPRDIVKDSISAVRMARSITEYFIEQHEATIAELKAERDNLRKDWVNIRKANEKFYDTIERISIENGKLKHQLDSLPKPLSDGDIAKLSVIAQRKFKALPVFTIYEVGYQDGFKACQERKK